MSGTTFQQNQAAGPVVLVVHGSRSPQWVKVQEQWYESVLRKVGERIGGEPPLKLAFLEINEPSLEQTLREARQTGAGRVAILPFFLSKGGHVGEDIPAIANEVLGEVGWQLLDTDELTPLLARNAERRLRERGVQPGDPVIVSGYGSSSGQRQWQAIVENIRQESGAFNEGQWYFAPAGHFLSDPYEPLYYYLEFLRDMACPRAGILPFYLSISSYQEELIPAVMKEFPTMDIRFEPDAILPDEEIENWAADTIHCQLVKKGS